ncbi:MAG: signal peptidase I [Actinomycetota bacterium]|nr:signal peptidase I [Actinomycetota bacterium]
MTAPPLPRRRASWREVPVVVVLALVLSAVLKTFVLQVFYIPSGSMEPTLHGCKGCPGNDRVLVSKLDYRFGEPERGDIVVFDGRGSFTDEDGQEKDYVKRVIGEPGDVVACCDADGRVTVNSRALDEPYLFEDNSRAFGPVTVGPGRLWVMGDHRSASSDSRDHGAVPVDAVVGRAVATVWPVRRVTWLR